MLTGFKVLLKKIISKIINFLYPKNKLYWKAPEDIFQNGRDNVENVFDTIYEKKVWGNGSGGGSDAHVANVYIDTVNKIFKENNIKKVLDIGCGDWQFSKFIDWSNMDYVGIDVVESVIKKNNEKFSSSNIKFICENPLSENCILPSVDLILVKDVLQHLSNKNVIILLDKILKSKSNFVLVTNDFDSRNIDINNGDTRPIDITKPPFNVINSEDVLSFNGKKVFLIRNNI